MVLSEEEFNESPLVRLHERMHVARRHSIDGTLMQLVKVVQWFNPAAHLLVHELKHLHEYQADRDVCRHPIDTKQYQRLLVKKAVGAHLYALASAFSQPPLKKRITMMQQQETHKWRMWLTLLFLPAGIGVTYAFSQPENRQKIERFVEDDLQVPPTLNVLPPLTPTTAEAPETADAASGTTEADEPVAHPETAEPDAAQPTTAEEGAQPAQGEATAPTNPSSAPDQKSAPTNRPDSAQTDRTGTTFFYERRRRTSLHRAPEAPHLARI